MRYRYITRNQRGSLETGIVEASSEAGAIDILQRQGLVITKLESIDEAQKTGIKKEIKIFSQKVSTKELVFFTRQLAILFSSNVSLVDALHTIALQAKKEVFHDQIEEIANDVNGGMAFSEAIAKHPNIFSPFFINMVKVGEVGGNLPKVLNYLADHQEKEYVLMSRIKGAMLYPAVILLACAGIFVVMGVFVLPNVSSMFQQLDVEELPLVTKIMLGSSDFLGQNFIYLFILFAIVVFFIVRYLKSVAGKLKIDNFVLKAPIIGQIFKNVYYARICENLGTLMRGGIPIVQALDTVSKVIGNSFFEDVLIRARDNVRKGEGISPIFAQEKEIIDPSLTQMIENAEKSGKIDKVLIDLSDFYNGEVERSVENLMTVLEPLLLIGIGGVVLLVAIGVIVPIYSLVTSIH